MTPTVSICMPTYNGAEYVGEAIASAQAQTFGEFEILVIDDGSSDATLDLVRGYARTDSRIRLLVNEANVGLVPNWNRCLLEARGTWIKFLFQDDVLEADCIGALLHATSQERRPFAACFRDFIFEQTVDTDVRNLYLDQQSKVAGWYQSGGMTAQEFCGLLLTQPPRNLIGEPTVTLFRRDVVAAIGLFDPLLVHLCDAEYWSRIATRHGVAIVPRPLAKFRIHGSSATAANSRTRKFRSETLDPIVLMHRYLFADGYAALRREMHARGAANRWHEEFWNRCRYARAIAADQLSRGLPTPAKDWAFLVDHLPAVEQPPLASTIRRVVRKLGQSVVPSTAK